MAVQSVLVLVLAALITGDKIRAAHVVACVAAGITFTKQQGRPEGVGLLPFTGRQLTAGGLVQSTPPAVEEPVALPSHLTAPAFTRSFPGW